MENSIANRLRQLREHWGGSARKLSLDLGLNPSTWNVYESSSSSPGSSILTVLAERGVNINWLLTGNGQMFESTSVIHGLLKELEADDAQSLGLSRLSLLATESTLALRVQILTHLASKSPEWVTLAEIAQCTSAKKPNVALCLIELIRTGQVETEMSQKGLETFRGRSPTLWSRASNNSELAALTLEAIRFLSHDVAHGLEDKPAATLILNATAQVGNGQDVLTQMKAFLRQQCSQEVSGEGETLRLIVAATIEKS